MQRWKANNPCRKINNAMMKFRQAIPMITVQRLLTEITIQRERKLLTQPRPLHLHLFIFLRMTKRDSSTIPLCEGHVLKCPKPIRAHATRPSKLPFPSARQPRRRHHQLSLLRQYASWTPGIASSHGNAHEQKTTSKRLNCSFLALQHVMI